MEIALLGLGTTVCRERLSFQPHRSPTGWWRVTPGADYFFLCSRGGFGRPAFSFRLANASTPAYTWASRGETPCQSKF